MPQEKNIWVKLTHRHILNEFIACPVQLRINAERGCVQGMQRSYDIRKNCELEFATLTEQKAFYHVLKVKGKTFDKNPSPVHTSNC